MTSANPSATHGRSLANLIITVNSRTAAPSEDADAHLHGFPDLLGQGANDKNHDRHEKP